MVTTTRIPTIMDTRTTMTDGRMTDTPCDGTAPSPAPTPGDSSARGSPPAASDAGHFASAVRGTGHSSFAAQSAGGQSAAQGTGGLHLLLAWMSPSFPVGAYTYSHGLEWAIEAGDVCDADSLAHWCAGVLTHGAGRSDAILLAHAMTAAHAGDVRTLRDLLDLARALQPSAERRLEATAQGDAFIAAVRDAWPPNAASQAGNTPAQSVFATLTTGPEAIPRGGWSYPLAVAVSAAAHGLGADGLGAGGLDADAVRFAYLHAFAANLVSAAVRAVPLGQTDGQRVLNRLGPALRQVSDEAGTASLDEIGGCAFAADIASMNHETQYTRLFRS